MRSLVLLLLAGAAIASPADSLTGADMLRLHRERRIALANMLGEGTLVLFSSASASYRDSRPDPNLLYLTGVDAPRAALVLRVERPDATPRSRQARAIESKLRRLARDLRRAGDEAQANRGARALTADARKSATQAYASAERAAALACEGQGPPRITETLYLPTGSPRAAVWNAPSLVAGVAAADATGINLVRDLRSLFPDLEKACADTGTLYLASRSRPAPEFEAALLRFRESGTDLVVRPADALVARLRAVKSPEEIARIEKACRLTTSGLLAAMDACRPGMTEYQMQAFLEFACRSGGAPRQAFASIVGSGPNSLILHYRENRRTFEDGDIVLMDVGAEYMGYAADVTRTFPASGRFTDEQAEVYDVVHRAQARAIEAVRPGAGLRDVNLAARAVITEAGYGRGIRHPVSHHVGLDVHDPAPRGRLSAGMIITVEPGIYLADRGFGIRIEDTVLVTGNGARIFSPGAPKCRSDIEALMADDRDVRVAVRGLLDRLDARDGAVRAGLRELDAAALPAILSILSDPNSPVREEAAVAAALLGDAGRAAVLSELESSGNVRRRGAVYALARMAAERPEARVLDALRRALIDRDPKVREHAARAIERIRGR